jgi:hypothetical protein
MAYFTAAVAARALVTKGMMKGLAMSGCVLDALNSIAKKYSGPVKMSGAHRLVLMCSVWVNASPIISLNHPPYPPSGLYKKPRSKIRICDVVQQ